MPGAHTKLRLDPWPPEYDSAIQFAELDADTTAVVNPAVEVSSWRAIDPQHLKEYEEMYFVDGVRRIDARVLADGQAKVIHGLFGSIGVGAVRVRETAASFTDIEVDRFLILGDGILESAEVQVGNCVLKFQGLASPSNSPLEVLGELQNLMRTREADVGRRLSRPEVCVFADGPLTYFASAKDEIVGVVKTIHIPYVTEGYFEVVRKLARGQRSPLFAIEDGKYNRYSWFLRVADGRKIDHALAGIIRLEVRAAVGLDRAVRIADFSAVELPRFVCTSARDSRAPQNLVPIGSLEMELRHWLGDAVLLQRGIERKLLEEVYL